MFKKSINSLLLVCLLIFNLFTLTASTAACPGGIRVNLLIEEINEEINKLTEQFMNEPNATIIEFSGAVAEKKQ